MDIIYQVRLLWPGVPISCFNLAQAITVKVNWTPSHLPIMQSSTSHIPIVIWIRLSLFTQGKHKQANISLQGFQKDSFKLGQFLIECHPTFSDLWLEKVNQEIPANDAVNNLSLSWILWAPTGFIFVWGGWHFSWAYECLDS